MGRPEVDAHGGDKGPRQESPILETHEQARLSHARVPHQHDLEGNVVEVAAAAKRGPGGLRGPVEWRLGAGARSPGARGPGPVGGGKG